MSGSQENDDSLLMPGNSDLGNDTNRHTYSVNEGDENLDFEQNQGQKEPLLQINNSGENNPIEKEGKEKFFFDEDT